jgi:hypothetical protein
VASLLLHVDVVADLRLNLSSHLLGPLDLSRRHAAHIKLLGVEVLVELKLLVVLELGVGVKLVPRAHAAGTLEVGQRSF